MANKVLIIVLGAVVLASLVVGGLLGAQFAGGGGADPATTSTGDAVATTAVTTTTTAPTGATTSTPASEQTADATPTTTATPEQQFSPDSVNTTAVEHELRTLVNEDVRGDRQPLGNEAVLDEMAQFHADNMAEQGYADFTAGGYNTKQRYEKFDRYSHCRVPTDNNAGIRDGQELEVNERVDINVSGDWNETQIAEQLLAEWQDDEDVMERLSFENAEEAGVGVTVTADARVYVTVDLC